MIISLKPLPVSVHGKGKTKEVKLSVLKHHCMKRFNISTRRRKVISFVPCHFMPMERLHYPLYRGPDDIRAGQNTLVKRKISWPYQELNSCSSVTACVDINIFGINRRETSDEQMYGFTQFLMRN
jgi:hypothetical protein